MTRQLFTRVLQASLMCCLAVILSGCEELFSALDNPIQTSISMSTSEVKLKVGEQNQRTATSASPATIVYASEDPAIATVDANGVVTGVAPGTTTITASVAAVDYWTAASTSYKVTVLPAFTMETTPLTFEAAVDGAMVMFYINPTIATGPVEYSTDGSTWSTYTSSNIINLAKAGDKVSFRGNNATYAGDYGSCNFMGLNNCYVYGNIMSLVKAEGFENETTLTADYTFKFLFSGNTFIKNHPEATHYLVLPATKLTIQCYNGMFQGCSGLTTIPVIDVDCNGASEAMKNMFSGCKNLTTVAKGSKISGTMGSSCCEGMFKGCTALESVPSGLLPSTNLAYGCYKDMFIGCSKLEKAPKLPATSLASICYYMMFYDCTILNEAWVKAPYNDSYSECLYMFANCADSGVLHTGGTGWNAGTNLPTNWTTSAYE